MWRFCRPRHQKGACDETREGEALAEPGISKAARREPRLPEFAGQEFALRSVATSCVIAGQSKKLSQISTKNCRTFGLTHRQLSDCL